MADVSWVQTVNSALNVVQVIALAIIAAKYRASNGNGPKPPTG